MSDYIPNPDPNRDKFGYGRSDNYDYTADPGSGRSGYILLAVMAGVALVGGLLYFGNPQNDQTARAPETTINTPAEQPAAPAIPKRPAQPATPAAPAAPQQ